MKTLIHNTTVVTCVAGVPEVLLDHDVAYASNRITHLQPSGALSGVDFENTIAGHDYVVTPGLVNAHHHLYQTLTRGLKAVQDAPLFRWLTELYQRWQHVDYDAVKTAAKVSIAELLLSGCTTTSDHFYLFPQNSDVRLEAVLEAAEELGIRIHACRGSMTLGASQGGLPPDCCTEGEDQVLRDYQRVVEQFHDPAADAMRRIDLAPCAPFNVSHDLFVETARLGRSLGVLLHTHGAETRDEEAYCLERFGKRPIEYLHDCGWLGSDVYLAHCVCLNDHEVSLLAESDTGVVHCPCSNMRLGSGIAPLTKLLQSGVKVGIGVDGSSSNDGGQLLAEGRQALLLQRVVHGPEALTVAQAFRLLTVGGAACLNREALGCVEVGACADVALYRRDEIALAGAIEQDPLGALMLCHAPRAEIVIVNGRPVVSGGRLVKADQAQLAADLNNTVRARFNT